MASKNNTLSRPVRYYKHEKKSSDYLNHIVHRSSIIRKFFTYAIFLWKHQWVAKWKTQKRLNLSLIIHGLQAGDCAFKRCFLLLAFLIVKILETSWANAVPNFSKRPFSLLSRKLTADYQYAVSLIILFSGNHCFQKLPGLSWSCVYSWKRENTAAT